MSIRPTLLILSVVILKINMSIESKRRDPAFAFPQAGAWLYFTRSPEYWSNGVLARPPRPETGTGSGGATYWAKLKR